MASNEAYERARHRVREMRSFYTNLLSFITVNIVLLIINFVVSPKEIWFFWVTIFWGIGIALHAVNTFPLKGKFLGGEWEEKMIKRIMKKEKKRKRK